MSMLRRLANLEYLAWQLRRVRCADCVGLPDYAVQYVDGVKVEGTGAMTCRHCGWEQGQIAVEYVEALAS